MAEDKEFDKKRQQVKKQTQKDVDDISVYVQDTMISVAAKIGETLKESVEEAMDGADASVIKSIGNDLTRQFKSAAKFSDTLASNNAKLNQGILTGKGIEKQQLQLQEKRSALVRKLLHAKKMGVAYSMEDKQLAFEALNVQEQQLEKDKERADGIKKALGTTGEIFTRISKNKFFGGLLNAEEGLKKMRSEAAKNGEAFSGLGGKIKLMGKGIGAAFKGLEKASIFLFVAQQIKKVIGFIVDLMLGMSKKVVETAQTFGVAKDEARKMVEEIDRGAKSQNKLYHSTTQALAAQKELVGQLDRGGKFMATSLTTMSFMQARLGLSADTAAKFVSNFEAFGKDSEKGVNDVLAMNNHMTNMGQSTATLNQVLTGVANASGQIRASFGFSVKSIARGVLAARKLGLSLSQTKNVSEGLLDFESSIASEMEAELLLGRDLQLDKARQLALQGDMVGATQEVMKTMKGLTKEERKRPLVMKALAKLSGLSTDELQDAYMLETDRSRQIAEANKKDLKAKKEYRKIAKAIMADEAIKRKRGEGDSVKMNELLAIEAKRLGLTGATRKELDLNVTAGQAFQETMTKAKDALQRFVGSGMLDKLVDLLTTFILRVEKVGFARAAFGGGDAEIAKANSEILLKQEDLTEKQIEKINDNQEKASQGFWSKAWAFTKGAALGGPMGGMTGAMNVVMKNAEIKTAQNNIQKDVDGLPKEAIVKDFTLRPLGKDTLTMAGGTKLGGNVEKLLEQLISVVSTGGNVYLDGAKVGQTLVLNSKLSN
tara:strand:+ start:3399 stop:5714 length:2316 start_codon:yes stop_codon:yes gene_type:complete